MLDVPAGLEGVVVAETAIGDVRGDEGFYHYRGYPAAVLATTRSFEEVWHLIHHGHLPTEAELDVAAHPAGLQGRLQNRKRMFAQQQI